MLKRNGEIRGCHKSLQAKQWCKTQNRTSHTTLLFALDSATGLKCGQISKEMLHNFSSAAMISIDFSMQMENPFFDDRRFLDQKASMKQTTGSQAPSNGFTLEI